MRMICDHFCHSLYFFKYFYLVINLYLRIYVLFLKTFLCSQGIDLLIIMKIPQRVFCLRPQNFKLCFDQQLFMNLKNFKRPMKSLEKTAPKVFLVGAGPGDPELLTIKAMRALKAAKAVLYDALVNEEILEYAPNAVKLFVGKRKGCHSYMQEQINDLLVQYAMRYGNVVRLKGGDPFVFGRGREEMDHLLKAGISVKVVPGISSALAVPAGIGIPLTHRKVAESFWVITGTTSCHRLSDDVELAAKSSATVVILMGMGKLTEIVAVFSKNGKKDTPVAVIQNGTRKAERSATGTIRDIEKKVAEQQLTSPAIIIIGEVVSTASCELAALSEDEFIYQNLDLSA